MFTTNLNKTLDKRMSTLIMDMETLRKKLIAQAMMIQWTWIMDLQTIMVGVHHKIIHLVHLLISLQKDRGNTEGVLMGHVADHQDPGKEMDILHKEIK